jgi:hypothetical protein
VLAARGRIAGQDPNEAACCGGMPPVNPAFASRSVTSVWWADEWAGGWVVMSFCVCVCVPCVQLALRLDAHLGSVVRGLDYDAENNRLLTCSYDRSVKVFEAAA